MNEGGSDALNTVATALAASSLITVNTASFDIGTIGIGGSADAVINISIDPSAQIGDAVQFDYTVESEPYSANTLFAMSVGLIVEDFETGDFTNNDWEFSGNAIGPLMIRKYMKEITLLNLVVSVISKRLNYLLP